MRRHENEDDGDGDVLTGSLGEAVQIVRQKSAPESVVQRVVIRASRLGEANRKPARRYGRRVALAGLAAAALLAVAIHLGQTQDGWAQVIEAVNAKPWIRGRFVGEGRDGDVFWLSSVRDVAALRAGKHVHFDDLRLGVRYTYDEPDADSDADADAAVVYRVSLPGFVREEFTSFESAFFDAFAGRSPEQSPLHGADIVRQEEKVVDEDGVTWKQYQLTLHRHQTDEQLQFVFRVDPKTNLPASLQINSSAPKRNSVSYQFDYPADEAGPQDIYALGVSRQVKLVDRVPSDDLKTVIARVQESRDRFGDFRAIAVQPPADENDHWGSTGAKIVWRKGNRWRIAMALGKNDDDYLAQLTGREASDAWWQSWLEASDQIDLMVCDGKAVYRNQTTDTSKPVWKKLWNIRRGRDFIANIAEASGVRPDFFAYRMCPAPSQRSQVSFDTEPQEGPPNSVFLESNQVKYWLDPSRSYAALQYEMAVGGQTDTYIMEDLVQGPHGVWYPTVVRLNQRADVDEDGEMEMFERVTRFFVRFDVDLPDELFER